VPRRQVGLGLRPQAAHGTRAASAPPPLPVCSGYACCPI
jgi:hypothetical protein